MLNFSFTVLEVGNGFVEVIATSGDAHLGEKEREKEREKETETETERERMKERDRERERE